MHHAVLFDLYETLITEFLPDWQPRPSIAARLGLAPEAFAAAWHARHHERMCGLLPDYATVLRGICAELAQPIDEGLLHQLSMERVVAKAAPFGTIDPAILQMLERLQCRGVPLGVVSNCTPEEVTAWSTCQLAASMDAVVFSYQAGCAKPAPEIYHLACRRLGVAPQHVAFVGDGGSDELIGATRAGLTAYRATWFLDRWPDWKRASRDRQQQAVYPQLRQPEEVVTLFGARGPGGR